MSTIQAKHARSQVTYVLRNVEQGGPVFQDVVLPDGSVIRQVDRAVHEEALRRAEARLKALSE